ncbi:MAG: hypothetical protein B6U72_05215 [Candidatus Altiarchaeales archaeon ex4484_2]|nr:MAG: hypothetical protein B6U72_05215 [Candidatus Altiarchaeales archaeon ex4484_2]
MKLLICATEYYPYGSGIANVAYNVTECLKRVGIDCTTCSPTGPDIKLGNKALIQKFGRLGLIYYWYSISNYLKKRGDEYTLVWFHNPLILENNLFKNSLVTIHITSYGQIVHRIFPPHLHIYKKASSKIEKYCLDKIDKKTKFTGVSPQVCRELEELGVSKENVTYIPNGVDTQRFKPTSDKKLLRKRFNIPEEDLIILSLGRLSDSKRPYTLIDVFSLIKKKLGNVTLVIAGEGELLEKTKRLVRKRNIKNIKFLGYVDHEKDVPDLYACSDYYIMTSKYEGQPLTLLEAMSSGLPCIVSNIPNLKIVEDADCGIVVDFGDEEKASEEIISYIEKNNSNQSSNARNYALNNLDWEVIAEKYLKEFERVLSD